MSQFLGRIETSTIDMYGANDLSTYPLFQGGFINFGYWDQIPAVPTEHDRIQASRRLYEVVLDRLNMTSTDRVLEIGCGRGLGCRLALDQYHPRCVSGLDATPEQIERCCHAHADRLVQGDLQFVLGHAEAMPFPDAHFTKLYSVEVAQHFPSLPNFFHEAFRVLQPGGCLAITTFFRQPGASLEAVMQLIQTAEAGIDFFPPIDECLTQLQEIGFVAVRAESIGPKVWQGFDRWNNLVTPHEWGKNWWIAYQEGLVDYYIIEARKPEISQPERP